MTRDQKTLSAGQLPFYRGGAPLTPGPAYFTSSEMMATFYGPVTEHRLKLRKPKFVDQTGWGRFDANMLRVDPSPILELEEEGYDSAVWVTTIPKGRMFTVFALDGTAVAKAHRSNPKRRTGRAKKKDSKKDRRALLRRLLRG